MGKNLKTIFLVFLLSFIVGCSVETSTNSNSDTTQTTYQDTTSTSSDTTTTSYSSSTSSNEITSSTEIEREGGTIKVKFVTPNIQRSYEYEASGGLIATPDKIAQAISAALKVSESNIKQEEEDGTWVITNVPPTADASISYKSEDGYGVQINDIAVKKGETVDLGEIELKPLYDFSIKVLTNRFSEVWLNINSLDLYQRIPTGEDVIIKGIPEGRYFLTLSDINGNVLLSRYVSVGNETQNVTISLDDLVFEGSLTGKVIDSTGNPIQNALVFLKPDKDNYLLAITDDNGYFKFTNLAKGTYTVLIKKEGFIPKTVENIDLSSLSKDLGTIFLSPSETTGAIAGYVYFSDSTEHAGIDITVERLDGEFETKQNGSLIDGAFLITGLPEGKYRLHFGKSSDSSYEEVTTEEIEVIAGVTTVLEDPIILHRLTGTVEGTIKLPEDFEGLENLKIDILDSTGNVVTTYSPIGDIVNGTFSFTIQNVPVGNDYYIKVYGSDKDGNLINTIVKELGSLSVGETLTIDTPIEITYVDPNPPEFKVVNVYSLTENVTQDENGNYFLNPGNTVNIEVLAVDPDGDNVTYEFDSEFGEFIAMDPTAGKATWKSPDEGGIYSIVVKAKSNARTTSKTISFKVNHYPEITVISPAETDITNNQYPKEYKANEEVVINTSITDPDSDNVTIRWFSDLQGDLGDNENLQKVLIPGTHTITLEVQDEHGLKTVKTFYIKVNPMDLVWLKAPDAGTIKLYTTEDGIDLPSTYQIPIATTDKTLLYESLDESVATVDSNGIIYAVKAGTTKVRVYSQEKDENGNPLYEFYITVRVIDNLKTDDNGTYTLSPGEIRQVKVDKTYTVKLTNLELGKYEILIFDDKDIISESYTRSEIYADGYRNSYDDGNTYYQLEVLDKETDYELKLIPKNRYSSYSGKEYVKIALFPGWDVKDKDGNLLSSIAWDGNTLEPNDVKATAYEIKLGQAVYSDVNIWKHDYVDWYRLSITTKGYYTVKFQTLSGTYDYNNVYFRVYDPSGSEVGSTRLYRIGWSVFSFEAKTTGNYYIKIYSDYNRDAYYRFIIYPSITNGLKQDVNGEPNDSEYMATPLELLQEIKADVGVGADPYDWYDLKNLEKDKTYTVRLRTYSGTESCWGAELWAKIYSPSGSEIAKGSIDGECTNCQTWFDFTPKESGNYKIKVYRESWCDTYYALEVYPSVDNGLKQDAKGEPNNTPNLATPIKIGEEIENWVGVGFDTVDYYEVKITTPGKYVLTISILDGTESWGYYQLITKFYNSDCRVDGNIGKTGSCTYTISEPGTYILKIYRENNYDTHYKFSLTKEEE
ncbi:MAG: carboxypeptidase regulatory-like domain-containing protein [Desulfurobacteriaceae bacterium]